MHFAVLWFSQKKKTNDYLTMRSKPTVETSTTDTTSDVGYSGFNDYSDAEFDGTREQRNPKAPKNINVNIN